MISITKRDGSVADLDVEKIKRCVAWASEGFEVNPIELEAGSISAFREGISTREIQEQLIQVALRLTSLEESDWRYVAGRLFIMNIWKETELARGYGYGDYVRHVLDMTEEGLYDKKLMLSYSLEDLAIAGEWINPKLDLDYDYAGANLLAKRYLLRNELPQEAFLTVSLLLASVESTNKLVYAKYFYEAISQRKISLATPLLSNLRLPNGNLSSCFVGMMGDSIESIFDTVKNVAKISQNGGGVGINLSHVRATGSSIRNIPGVSGGVVPWVKILNDTAVAVNQTGKRAGACTTSLDIWHLDIEEFLEMQTENGDQRKKAYDIFPQLVVPDEFMQRADLGQDWTVVDPQEVLQVTGQSLASLWGKEFEVAYRQVEYLVSEGVIRLHKRVNARELLKKIEKIQLETGLPYIFFKDTWNRTNPNQHAGYIPAGNLCMESTSNVAIGEEYHCCNLVSINLANTEDDEFQGICSLAVRILDNAIDLTLPPISEAKHHNELYRTIGVGMMGLADWLAKNRYTWKKPEHKQYLQKLSEDFGYYCTKASADLAVERGSYQVFEGSEWSKGNLIGKPIEWFWDNSYQPQRWVDLSNQVKRTGIRNSQVTAIAPNTSSALLQGCTASVLPVYNKFFYEKNGKGAVPVCPPFIKERLWHYVENKNLDQNIVIDWISEIQKWVDTGISMELVFNLNSPNVNAKHIFDCLISAWKKGCKSIYYIRTITKTSATERNSEDACVTCAN